jgi:hypothetical protein
MLVTGRRLLPCGHQRVRVTIEPGGERTKRCAVCKRKFEMYLAPSLLGDRLGPDVYRVCFREVIQHG